jgi:DNA polymerase III alpha subunit
MKTDKFGHCIYEEQDLLELVYQNKTDLIKLVYTDNKLEILDTETKTIDNSLYEINIEDYDSICQSEWLMPDKYKEMDIETWLYNQIPPWDDRNQRLRDELFEFEVRNMMDLLRWLKYFVDTARANNIVWGVGRGSSVASYVLYLIGVHKIDPIKYDLDWWEFLR